MTPFSMYVLQIKVIYLKTKNKYAAVWQERMGLVNTDKISSRLMIKSLHYAKRYD